MWSSPVWVECRLCKPRDRRPELRVCKGETLRSRALTRRQKISPLTTGMITLAPHPRALRAARANTDCAESFLLVHLDCLRLAGARSCVLGALFEVNYPVGKAFTRIHRRISKIGFLNPHACIPGAGIVLRNRISTTSQPP